MKKGKMKSYRNGGKKKNRYQKRKPVKAGTVINKGKRRGSKKKSKSKTTSNKRTAAPARRTPKFTSSSSY